MSNYILDQLNSENLLLVTLFREAARTWEQMDHIKQEKINELFRDPAALGQLPALIHPQKIESDTVWKFAFRSSLAAQALLTDPDEQPERALILRNVEAMRHADLTTILVKCQKKPVGMFLSAMGLDEQGGRDLDDDDIFTDDEEEEGGL